LSFLTKDVLSDADHILGRRKPSFFNAARYLGHQGRGVPKHRDPVKLLGGVIYMVIKAYLWIFVQASYSGGPAHDFSAAGGRWGTGLRCDSGLTGLTSKRASDFD
jgi:hypothetical protein